MFFAFLIKFCVFSSLNSWIYPIFFVVPVDEEQWTHPPFGAEIDEAGRIFARGSQDMKSVGMQYLGAIAALKSNGVRLKRTIHVTFVPGKLNV